MVVQSIISVATPCPRMRRSLRRDELEQSLLKGLAESVLRIEVIDHAVAEMEEARRKGHEKPNAELERMRQRKLQLEAELARLVNAIAEGQPSQSSGRQSEKEKGNCRRLRTSCSSQGPDR